MATSETPSTEISAMQQPINGKAIDAQPKTPPSVSSEIIAKRTKQKKDRGAYSALQVEAKLQTECPKQMSYPVRKPGSVNFFRVCDQPDSELAQALVIDAGLDGFSFINGALLDNPEVRRRVKSVSLFVCVNHAGQYFVWPVALGSPKTAVASMKVVNEAKKRWVRIQWNGFAQSYDMEPADPQLYPELVSKEPSWNPSGSEIMDEAFADNAIDEPNDPRLLKILKGLR